MRLVLEDGSVYDHAGRLDFLDNNIGISSRGTVVTIATPRLGTLANRVNTSDRIAPWRYGAVALMRDLARRGLPR